MDCFLLGRATRAGKLRLGPKDVPEVTEPLAGPGRPGRLTFGILKVPRTIAQGRCRATPPHPPPRLQIPPKGPTASHGKGPGLGRSRPGTFSRQQPWLPGETGGTPGDPTRSQLQGTRPGKRDSFPGTPSPAFTPVPPPPSPSPAVRLRAPA